MLAPAPHSIRQPAVAHPQPPQQQQHAAGLLPPPAPQQQQHIAGQSQPAIPHHQQQQQQLLPPAGLQPQPHNTAGQLHQPYASAHQAGHLPGHHQGPPGHPQLPPGRPQLQSGQTQMPAQSMQAQYAAAQHGGYQQGSAPAALPSYLQQQPPWSMMHQPSQQVQGQGFTQQSQAQGLLQQPPTAPWAQQMPQGHVFGQQQAGQHMRHAHQLGTGQHIQAQPMAPALHLQQGFMQGLQPLGMNLVPARAAVQHPQVQGVHMQPPWLQRPN